MKKLLLSVLCLSSLSIFAQNEESNWKRGGNASLMFNQAAFNNEWTGGGTSNVAANLAISYAVNYKKDAWTWDNNFFIDYGITKLKNDEFARKINDRFEINSLLGRQASEFWYYSLFMNFKTQLSNGYKYSASDKTLINRFLSPGYFQLGPGMLWKKSDNLKVNLAPATLKVTSARKQFTNYVDSFYGVKRGKNFNYELGLAVGGYAKFNLMDNVSMENILNLYSNYLDKPQNIDIDYTANLVMTINKYLSANFTFQAIYDDNAVKGFQVREVLGLGVNYKL
ncbi:MULTISPECIES: DUF3078 domain-containing protein [Capnocytophaga]|uniref:DUF3078 domain-containing protein n=1 Tax=Capnocytophaga canis TaxID=1848903 RepID=A0A0B7I1C6_9FLAO|nr:MULTISPECIES: DUF3078 domain-containing protein [Capnocytophaga]ATA72811.1 hypothetical protein CGC49_05645 [Capnocytophaga sp. H4358]ATA74904.1 hypothetical protein CGC52_05405 [Capnocytophaga sp. H2931]RIY35554.1 DUF3078 domain-containing protein [Capnocytophaga canis]CEN44579.1 Outer membrane insertion signal domain protein [Capnocytophaga canis]CEN45417.1 Outer membrane insertion signal domain protein [Capnocytophaga canis]